MDRGLAAEAYEAHIRRLNLNRGKTNPNIVGFGSGESAVIQTLCGEGLRVMRAGQLFRRERVRGNLSVQSSALRTTSSALPASVPTVVTVVSTDSTEDCRALGVGVGPGRLPGRGTRLITRGAILGVAALGIFVRKARGDMEPPVIAALITLPMAVVTALWPVIRDRSILSRLERYSALAEKLEPGTVLHATLVEVRDRMAAEHVAKHLLGPRSWRNDVSYEVIFVLTVLSFVFNAILGWFTGSYRAFGWYGGAAVIVGLIWRFVSRTSRRRRQDDIDSIVKKILKPRKQRPD